MSQKEKSKKLESYWRKHILNLEKSRLSCKAYCTQHKLTIHQMGYWKTRIKNIDSRARDKGTFSRVQIQPDPVTSKQQLRLNLTLPNGIVVGVELEKRQDLIDVIQKLAG